MAMCRVLIVGLVAALELTGSAVDAQQGSTPALRRIINRTFTVHLVDDCSVPSAIIHLSRMMGIPAGAEYLPGPCFTGRSQGETRGEIDLVGLALETAIDQLVASDPRYRWAESEGVILVRPLASWADSTNFLNHPVESLQLRDAHMGEALDVIVAPLRGSHSNAMSQLHMKSEQGDRRFSVHVGATSVAGALSAVVGAHGGLLWEARGHTKTTFGEQDGTIYLTTFDLTDGIGATTKVRR